MPIIPLYVTAIVFKPISDISVQLCPHFHLNAVVMASCRNIYWTILHKFFHHFKVVLFLIFEKQTKEFYSMYWKEKQTQGSSGSKFILFFFLIFIVKNTLLFIHYILIIVSLSSTPSNSCSSLLSSSFPDPLLFCIYLEKGRLLRENNQIGQNKMWGERNHSYQS